MKSLYALMVMVAAVSAASLPTLPTDIVRMMKMDDIQQPQQLQPQQLQPQQLQQQQQQQENVPLAHVGPEGRALLTLEPIPLLKSSIPASQAKITYSSPIIPSAEIYTPSLYNYLPINYAYAYPYAYPYYNFLRI